MGLFKKLFNKDKKVLKKGFVQLSIESITRETKNAVAVSFSVPPEEKSNFKFIPGQYLNFAIEIDGKEIRRSYSICSGVNESLTIAVKEVEDGTVSKWFNREAKEGDLIWASTPQGSFTLTDAGKKYVAFAAGSGITPIMSIAKAIDLSQDGELNLYYSNKTEDNIIFHNQLNSLSNSKIQVKYLLSQEQKEGFNHGRFSKDKLTELIKENIALLKADGFYICGPEKMIVNTSEVLKTFGISEDKIHYELFTPPVLLKSNETEATATYTGLSRVTVILDDEEDTFDLETDGDTILDEVESYGIDAPFSCRGGICCTCKAKVLKGSARMDTNMALTDSEVEEGYILTCQAHPNSEEIVVSYDE